MLKKSALNTGVKSLISGGAIAPLALGAGAIYFLNKNREKFTGYDTQQAYEDARTERIANKRLDKITDRMTSGKDYGNYEDALLDSGAGAVKIDDVIYSGPDYQGGDNNNNNGGSTSSKSSSKSSSRQSRQTSGPGGLHSYYRGGIASL